MCQQIFDDPYDYSNKLLKDIVSAIRYDDMINMNPKMEERYT